MSEVYAILIGVLVLPIAIGLGISLALPDAPANSHQARIEHKEPRKRTAGKICGPCVGPHINLSNGRIEMINPGVGISLF